MVQVIVFLFSNSLPLKNAQKIKRTGDQGVFLPSGYLQITGRLKELINRGGEKISPLEVDSALLRVDGVSEAVCFGVEDEKYGEVVWAGVVLKPGQPAGAEERIKKALDGRLASFKIPTRCFSSLCLSGQIWDANACARAESSSRIIFPRPRLGRSREDTLKKPLLNRSENRKANPKRNCELLKLLKEIPFER